MGAERNYGAIEVMGKAQGMNQAGWEGAIADSEATYLFNMGTNKDGEWQKRKGYHNLETFEVAGTAPVAKLHWHTDEGSLVGSTVYATGANWVETGDEITSASSGEMTANYVAVAGPYTLDGESVYALTAANSGAYVKMKSSFNLNTTAGRLVFNFFLTHAAGNTAATPPTQNMYIFYGHANFNLYINTVGDLIWNYASGVTINAGPVNFLTWTQIDLRWDNSVGGAIYPYRFQFYKDGTRVAYVDGSTVTIAFETDVFFFNTGSAGTSALYQRSTYTGYQSIAFIRTWDSSAATVPSSAITGIHNNSSQQRAVITAGVDATPCGVVYLSPSWAAATGTYTIGAVRTSATECQGNIYIVDGTDDMKYIIGSATAITVFTDMPETAKWIEEYHGHLWIAGLGTSGAYSVRCSTIDDFVTSAAVSWPAVNQVIKCRDTVRGIKSYAGQLVVGTRSTIESITGYQPHDFAKTIISSGANCASHWSMKEVPLADGAVSALIWAGYDGVYMMVGQQISKISWAIQDFYDTLSKTEIEESHAVDCRDRGEYMLAVSDGSTSDNNYVLVYNYRKGDWYIWKYAHKMDVLGKYYRSGKEIILGGDSSGNLFELNRGESDNGAAINGYALTKWFDGGVPDQDKDFRKLYAWFSPVENYSVEVGWSTNYREGIVEPSVVAGTDGNDYRCIVSHEPSVVAGDDGNDYYCTDAHTAAYLSKPGAAAWQANHDYAANDIVTPSTPDGHVYRVTTDGGISGTTEPDPWDDVHGNTTSDGDLVWTNDGASTAANFWTATGTSGRGEAWVLNTAYVANDDKKPITGGQYTQYWVPNNSVGVGTTWSALAGYSQENIEMELNDSVLLGETAAALFGTAVFGTAVFGTTSNTTVEPVDLYDSRGRAIRFMFRNQNADEPFSVRGIKVWYTYVPEFPA